MITRSSPTNFFAAVKSFDTNIAISGKFVLNAKNSISTTERNKVLQKFYKQECIPVGCVPPACCPYLPVCTAWGCTWFQGGVPGPRGVYLVPRGVPGPGGCTCPVGVPGPRGVYLVRGCVPARGRPAPVPPHVNRITDRQV